MIEDSYIKIYKNIRANISFVVYDILELEFKKKIKKQP